MGGCMPEPYSNANHSAHRSWSGPNPVRTGSAAVHDAQAAGSPAERPERWYINDPDRWRDAGRLPPTATGRCHLWALLCVHGVLSRRGVREAVTELTMREVAEAV